MSNEMHMPFMCKDLSDVPGLTFEDELLLGHGRTAKTEASLTFHSEISKTEPGLTAALGVADAGAL